MKILFINDFDEKGGAEVFVNNLSEKLNEKGHTTKTINPVTDEKYITHRDRVKKYFQKYFSPFNRRKLKKEIIKYDPDVIHLNNIHYLTIPILRTVKALDYPVAFTFHDYSYFTYCGGYHGEEKCDGIIEKCFKSGEISLKTYIFRKPIASLIKHYTDKTADLVTAPSNDLKEVLEKFTVAEKVPNFVDTEFYHPAGEGRDYFLFVGRLSEEKGLDILLEAYQKAEIDEPLKIAGKGEREKYEKMTEELGIQENVEFEGFVPEKDLPELYSNAMATVMPSRWRESAGIVLLESQACGTPVISSGRGGMEEYFSQDTGLSYESLREEVLSGKLETDLSNEVKESKKIRAFAKNHGLDNISQKFEEKYLKMSSK
jgi:glycosyltransferase involved in cell wall biosynthesis